MWGRDTTIKRLRGRNQTLKDKLDAVIDERDFYVKMLARQRTLVALEQAQIDKALARETPPKQGGSTDGL